MVLKFGGAAAAICYSLCGAGALAQLSELEQVRGPHAAAIDAIFADYGAATPGCAVAVDHYHEILHLDGYGMADLEQDVPISARSVFYAGSVSKQVVAMAAMILDRQGRIDLDAPVRRHLPALPAYADRTTVRQLLHHTSGIRDYFVLFRLAGLAPGVVITEDMIMAMLAQQQGLNFTPGEKWAYSNSAYFLISQIVKAVDGRELDAFAQEHIFGRLGMAHSRFQHNHRRLIKGKAHGYEPQADGDYLLADSTLDVVGSGGMYTTVLDLIRWDRNFYGSVLEGGQGVIEEMETSAELNSGEPTQYGIALSLRPYRGLRRISHGGALAGYRAMLQRFPDQEFTAAILCNSSEAAPQEYANAIADIFLAGMFSEDPAEPRAAPPPDEGESAFAELDPSSYAGRYYSPEVDNTLTVAPAGNGVRLLGAALDDEILTPAGADRFKSSEYGFTVSFSRDATGRPAAFIYDGSRVAALRFDRVAD
ncbi:MAG: hypothetical protein Tsb0010_15220 [Parvularculaceae bacterium]